MDQIVPDDRSKYEDLTLFSVSVVVNDDVTELYGVVDSESDDNENERETALENYLTQTNYNVSSQSMVCTKQTARKSDSKGQIPPSPAVVICWPPFLITSHQGFWILIQTLKELQICSVLNKEIGKDLQLEVHQQEDPNAPLHPLVLILAHRHVSLHS